MVSNPEERFSVPVDLTHRALTSAEQRVVRLALKKGWFMATGEAQRRAQQMCAWYLVCHENQADYVCFEERENGIWIEAESTDSVPLSHIFAQEKVALCQKWGLDDLRSRATLVPKSADIESLAMEVLELFARDRTPERTNELQRSAFEGMAEVVDGSSYWPDWEPGSHMYVYLIPIPDRPGRCVALRHQSPPLVDVPLEHFRLMSEA